MHSRLRELERFDRWLLSITQWELRQVALLVALAVDVPQVWLSSQIPPDMDAVTPVAGVVRKNNSALRISTIRAMGRNVRLTLRSGRIADVTSAESRRNNVTHLSATR